MLGRLLILIGIFTASFIDLSAQTGPGGVGATDGKSDLNLWFSADSGLVLSGKYVTGWSDRSGYNRDVTRYMGNPEKITGANNQPMIYFNGSENYKSPPYDLLNIEHFDVSPDSFPTVTIYTVFNTAYPKSWNHNDIRRLWGNDNHHWDRTLGLDYRGDSTFIFHDGHYTDTKPGNVFNIKVDTYYIIGSVWDQPNGCDRDTGIASLGGDTAQGGTGTDGNFYSWINGKNYNNGDTVRNNAGVDNFTIGAARYHKDKAGHECWWGDIGELIFFRGFLNTAERILIENYLSAKYNIHLIKGRDKYAGPSKTSYIKQVVGIGKESDGSHKSSYSNGLWIENKSFLKDNGDYIMAGCEYGTHNTTTQDLQSNFSNGGRWQEIWYFDVTDVSSNGGDVNLSFDFKKVGATNTPTIAKNYKLLYRKNAKNDFRVLYPSASISGNKVTFTVKADSLQDGYYTLASMDVKISPLLNENACQANYSYSINASKVTFNNTSSGSPDKYNWDFGDGNTSKLKNPTHTYSQNKSFKTCLYTLNTNTSCGDTICKWIKINDQSKVCDANFSYQLKNDSIYFTNTSKGTNHSYQWSYNYLNKGWSNFSKNENPVIDNAYYDSITVSLVISNSNCSDTAIQTISLPSKPVNCHAKFNFVSSGMVTQFNDISTNAHTYKWDFGDGSTSTAKNPQHVFSKAGKYKVTLKIKDTKGNCTDTYNNNVMANDVKCSASFTYTQNLNKFSFDGNQASGGDLLTYSWDFGDGGTTHSKYKNYTYKKPGTYKVCLTVEDTLSNCLDKVCKNVTVTTLTPQYNINGCVEIDHGTDDTAMVYVIYSDTIINTLELVDSVKTSSGTKSCKSFSIKVDEGQYILKAALTDGSINFTKYLPAYSDSTLFWENAKTITVKGKDKAVTITPVKGNFTTGNGSISGHAVYGHNKKEASAGKVPVLLLKDDHSPITYTYTDTSGYYEFNNIAYGKYRVYPELFGKTTNDLLIELDKNNDNFNKVTIEVNDHEINVSHEQTTAINHPVTNNEILKVYPNPFNNDLILSLKSPTNSKVEVTITDITGHAVYQDNVNVKNTDVTLTNLPELLPGAYILKLFFDNKEVNKIILKQ